MRHLVAVLLLAWTAAAVLAGESGFVPLFNGRDLEGWVVAGNAEGFRVVEGCLHSDAGKGGEWIHTARPYANFVLRVEWMLSQVGNSGVFVRNGPNGGGFEVQLLAPWTPPRDDLHCTGSLYGHVPARPRPDETPLRWRKMEIVAAYKQVTVRVDGLRCVQANCDQVPTMKGLALAGYVGLQDAHAEPGEWVRFRNIEIKDLDQDPQFVCSGLLGADPVIRRGAYEAAVALGAPMVEPLLELARGEAQPRQVAELALGRIAARASAPGAAAEAARVREVLLRHLEQGQGNGRPDLACAARLLGTVGQGDERTARVLQRSLLAGGTLAQAALQAMQAIPGRPITQALLAALPRVEPGRQPALLLALGARRDEAALPTLGRLAREKAGAVQAAAVRALGLLGSGRAVPVLEQVGAGAPDALRQAVVEALIVLLDSRGLEQEARLRALAAARSLAVTPAQKRALL